MEWTGRAVAKPLRGHLADYSSDPMVEYIPFLEQAEQGYYDENDNLLVEKLPSRSDLDEVRRHLS